MAMPAATGAYGPAPGAPELGLGELAAFVILAEERSFTRSARRLHLSQPGLSARIARLERALGVRLVNRTTRSVELTAEGQALLPMASSTVESFTAVRARFAAAEAHRRDLLSESRAMHFR